MSQKVLNDLEILASKPLSKATAMPKELYRSNEILSLEEDLIFNKEWICVGRATEIPKVGDYFTYQLGKQPIIILRDRGKKIKAMHSLALKQQRLLLGIYSITTINLPMMMLINIGRNIKNQPIMIFYKNIGQRH